MRTSHRLLQALVAVALAGVPYAASADAAADWIAFRLASGLPVDPEPSKPGEMPTFAGPVPDTLLVPLPDTLARGNGNGNGNGSSSCDRAFMVELAKSDGDVLGETGACP